MKISIEQLEAVLQQKFVRLKDDTQRGHVLQGLYPALYIAARQGDIELVDAIIACRQCIVSIGFLIGHFVRDRHIDDVVRAIDYIDLQERITEKDERVSRRLKNWVDHGREVD
jgi:hypothetical protein